MWLYVEMRGVSCVDDQTIEGAVRQSDCEHGDIFSDLMHSELTQLQTVILLQAVVE